MKILLVTNKTLNRGSFKRLDAGYWNFYLPMLQLGHEVEFYDISSPNEKEFMQIVEDFKPEVIFSMLTFDKAAFPLEPLEDIKKITDAKQIKTFNWFCDDTWRFNSVSSKVCWNFTACSTPEPTYVSKYKEIGYQNIVLGAWHTNFDLFHINESKLYDVAFCGLVNSQRANMVYALKNQGIKVQMFFGVSQEDMMMNYSLSKMGINFSVNENDQQRKTQMKLRMIEIPSTKCMLLTENTDGLEELFVLNKEVITFTDPEEMLSKARYLLENDSLRNKIAEAGYQRCLKSHNSKTRIKNILDFINSI